MSEKDCFFHDLLRRNEQHELRTLTPEDSYDVVIFANERYCMQELVSNTSLAKVLWSLYSIESECFRQALVGSKRDKRRLVRSVLLLYVHGFSLRCRRELRAGARNVALLEDACYMLWGMDCGIGTLFSRGPRHIIEEAFSVLRSILSIDHVLCQESAIHALGHLHSRFPRESEACLDEFLLETQPGHPLHDYATAARRGVVQ